MLALWTTGLTSGEDPWGDSVGPLTGEETRVFMPPNLNCIGWGSLLGCMHPSISCLPTQRSRTHPEPGGILRQGAAGSPRHAWTLSTETSEVVSALRQEERWRKFVRYGWGVSVYIQSLAQAVWCLKSGKWMRRSVHLNLWMFQHLNMWRSQQLDLGVFQCVTLWMCQQWIASHLNVWTSQYFNMWMSTCEHVNKLNVSMFQSLNMQTSQPIGVWCLGLWTCVSTPQHANVLMSPSMIVSITTHECHNTMVPKTWVSCIFLPDPAPQRPREILAHRAFNPCENSVLVQISSGSYRWKDLWSEAV